jgi:uncharacterized protein YbbK (DUF523 family)
MKKILVSACLLGENVRYNAEVVPVETKIKELSEKYEIIPFCPEVEGGLDVPRDPCEIVGIGGGEAVLDGQAKVMGKSGKDCTKEFVKGAALGAEKAYKSGVEFAVIKERSPSCGSSMIYTGNFDGERIKGEGVFSAALRRKGIKVLSEENL